jgi:RNase P subunit RPR2
VLKIPVRGTGTSCASCHKPLVAWTKATFSHPSAGEHSYRSFACVKCHPNGYSTAYCSCHGATRQRATDPAPGHKHGFRRTVERT